MLFSTAKKLSSPPVDKQLTRRQKAKSAQSSVVLRGLFLIELVVKLPVRATIQTTRTTLTFQTFLPCKTTKYSDNSATLSTTATTK